jgi:hypothetical protein
MRCYIARCYFIAELRMTTPPESPSQIAELLRSDDPIIEHRLSYGAFVGMRYPYLYIETPKAACTTTKVHLWNLEGLGPLSDPNNAHFRRPDDPRPSLLSVDEARAIEAMCAKSIYRFCVWRDPVQRLASCYMAKIRLRRDPGIEWTLYRRRIARAFGLGLGDEITFEHFAKFACALPDERRETHFMSQWRLTLSDFLRYDRIVRMDRYADDMAEVYRALGVPRSEWPDFASACENFTGGGAIEIPQAAAAMIREAYGKDYEMFDPLRRSAT